MSERELVAKWRKDAYAHEREQPEGSHGSTYTGNALRKCADELEALLNSRVGGEAGLPLNAHELGHDAMDDFMTVLNTNLDRGKHGFYESFANAWQVLVRRHIAALALRGLAAHSPGGVGNDGYGLRGAFREGYMLGTRGSFDKETYGSEEAAWANSETGKTTLRPTPPEVTADNLGPIPSRLSADWVWPIYQDKEVMAPLVKSLQAIARPGERVIYRDAFRWKDAATDDVLSNHYECQSVQYLAESFGYEVVWDFNHAAVIRDAAALAGGK